MIPHKLALCLLIFFLQLTCFAQKKPPTGGRLAIIVDERLAALRATPQLNAQLVRRLSRGRLVAVRSMKTSGDGITFLLVNVSSRTHGWIQRDAVVSPSRSGDDRKLLTLIQRSEGFDCLARAREGCDRDADEGAGNGRTQRREARNAKEHVWTPRRYDLRPRERKKRVRRRDWREAVPVSREGG